MTMPRVVATETLDGLRESDPAAIGSRRDLQRVHRVMGTRAIVLQAIRDLPTLAETSAPLRILELGAGDGSLMLGVARALTGTWPPVALTLLDRQKLVERATVERYAAVGWTASSHIVDVLDWIASAEKASREREPGVPWDLIIANLFLHHFEGNQLATLLASIASQARCFFACEPRRAWLPLAGSHLIGAIGANAVTREDAVLSVHAGFREGELTAIWPHRSTDWKLTEYSAGLFSHCFRAERLEAAREPTH